VVVAVPGMGDDIQAIKAGILEVADLFAVNKADLAGADRTVRELRSMLELRHAVRAHPGDHDAEHRPTAEPGSAASTGSDWDPPILKVVASTDQGVPDLWKGIQAHRAFLDASGQRKVRDQARAQMQFVALLRERLLKEGLEKLEREKGRLTDVSARIAARTADPYELAEQLAARLGS